ncbi:MAG: DUF4156 domain-containing protein [Agarilytica sp.]
MRILSVIILVTGLAACQWVKPTEGADQVSLVKRAHILNCEKLGSTTSTVKEKVGIVKRKERKVVDELVTLAKNEAAGIGGDTIVANGTLQEGKQAFDIYRCM